MTTTRPANLSGQRTSVTAWLDARGQTWKDQVKFVAIDMCTVFKAAVREALPRAVLVVDHFHIVQLANQALTEVRRRATLQQRGRRGRKGNREWELRNRLARSAARMHGKHLDPMVLDLHALPEKIGRPILDAWNAKQDLLDLLDLARTHPDRHPISHRLTRFYTACADSGLEGVRTPRHHHLHLVAGNPRVHPHRRDQCRLRGHEPRHQDHRPRRLRLPQSREPTPTHPLRHQPQSPRTPQPHLTSKSRDGSRTAHA